MQVNFTPKAKKLLAKLDTKAKLQIKKLVMSIEAEQNPRAKGKALQGDLKGLWRYRSGDYRIICNIKDDELLILVIHLAHRKEVYKKNKKC